MKSFNIHNWQMRYLAEKEDLTEDIENAKGSVKEYENNTATPEQLEKHPELKLEKCLKDLEEVYPSFSEYEDFRRGMELIQNAYNDYMEYPDE